MNPLGADLDHVVAHTPWEELRGARIFVTGGTGFFGRWLIESYVWAWERLGLDGSMTVLTRSGAAFEHPAIRWVNGDVRSFQLPGARFSHVIHAAADATPELCRTQPLLVLDTIVDGTRRVLDLAVEAGAKRFLLASSGAVYGPQPPDMTHVPETYSGGPDVTDPRWVYAEGKRVAEMLCTIYGIDCVIARGFTFVGPYLPLDAHFAIGNFIRDRLNGGPVRVGGDGTAIRSYLYAADLAIWLWTILVSGRPGRPYNVGSERSVDIAGLARIVAGGGKVEIAGTPAPGKAPDRYVPSTARARSELGLKELVPLEEAIRRTVAASEAVKVKEEAL